MLQQNCHHRECAFECFLCCCAALALPVLSCSCRCSAGRQGLQVGLLRRRVPCPVIGGTLSSAGAWQPAAIPPFPANALLTWNQHLAALLLLPAGGTAHQGRSTVLYDLRDVMPRPGRMISPAEGGCRCVQGEHSRKRSGMTVGRSHICHRRGSSAGFPVLLCCSGSGEDTPSWNFRIPRGTFHPSQSEYRSIVPWDRDPCREHEIWLLPSAENPEDLTSWEKRGSCWAAAVSACCRVSSFQQPGAGSGRNPAAVSAGTSLIRPVYL